MASADVINLCVVVAWLLGMLGLGVWLSRYVRTGADYFIAGRSLNRWVICGSVMSTNVAAVYLLGPAGRAYRDGVALLLMAWTGNVLAAISAVTFLPRFRRLGLTTVTELLRDRYGVAVSQLLAGMWVVFYAMFSGVTMLTCATVLTGSFDLPGWFHLGGLSTFETVTAAVALVVTLYCLASGLLAVVYTDLLQSFLIIFGAVILLPLGLKAGGGVSVLFDTGKIAAEKWVMWRPPGQPDDCITILMMIVLGFPYWFTSQYMLQRSFAGRNVEEASKGLLWAALLTGPLTLCYIVPAMAASVNPAMRIEAGQTDSILPFLAREVMPVGISGLFLAALVAASNSTASSYLNSLATVFEQDLYRPLVKNRSDRHYLTVGRLMTMLAGLGGLTYALYCHRQGYDLLGSAWLIGSIFQPSIFVVTAAALFWNRASPAGGMACLACGLAYAVAGAGGAWQTVGEAAGVLPTAEGAVVSASLLEQTTGWFFRLDHTRAPIRALVGMPLSAVVLILVSLFTKADTERAGNMLARMRFTRGEWTTGRRLAAAGAVLCLAGMVVEAVLDRTLPKPWNVLLFLGLLSGFVAGVLGASAALLPADEVGQTATQEEEPGGISSSLIARVFGSGRAWAVVYGVAAVTVVVLYLAG